MYYYLICMNKINDKFDDIIFHSVKINLKNIFVVERFLRLNTYKTFFRYLHKGFIIIFCRVFSAIFISI